MSIAVSSGLLLSYSLLRPFTENYMELCTVVGDISHLPQPAKEGPTGYYYEVYYDIVLIFGLTELQIMVAWQENVSFDFMDFEATRFLSNSYFQGVEKRYVLESYYFGSRRSKFEFRVGVLLRSCMNQKYFELGHPRDIYILFLVSGVWTIVVTAINYIIITCAQVQESGDWTRWIM